MKHVLLLVLLALVTIKGYNQESTAASRLRNSVYGNLLGDGSLVSINYERALWNREHFFLTGKIGLGLNEEFCIIFCDNDLLEFTTIPFSLTGNVGRGRHYFEFGLGGTVINDPEKDMLYPVLGYRFHPRRAGRFAFRAYSNIYPINARPQYILFFPVGISMGVGF